MVRRQVDRLVFGSHGTKVHAGHRKILDKLDCARENSFQTAYKTAFETCQMNFIHPPAFHIVPSLKPSRRTTWNRAAYFKDIEYLRELIEMSATLWSVARIITHLLR